MSDFILYLKQRFKWSIFLLLTFFLLLFSKNKLVFGIADITNFVIILFFLMLMRLYDDLQNWVTDRNKSNRIYTALESKKKLAYILIILIILYLGVLIFFNIELAKKAALFFGINHILYLIFFNYWNFKSYLPLLKYPIIYMALNGHFDLTAIALFLAMIAFEILDDIDFPVSKKLRYAFACISISLLIPKFNLFYFIVLFLALSITVFLLSKKTKTVPYLFLLLFLLTRLTVLFYAI